MQAFQTKFTLNCAGRLLDLSKPGVMGILNFTPDSFYSGSRISGVDQALETAEKMLKEGADILDIGAQSTRPGSNQISWIDEKNRLETIVPLLVKAFPQAFFSIDTYHAKVAEFAINEGFHIVNDVSSFDDDADMLPFLKSAKVPYIMMHKKGNFETMQKNPHYDNLIIEILDYFKLKVELLNNAGLSDIILDPGFGLGKNLNHNLELLRSLESFSVLNLPILAGLSRKKMIRDIANVEVEDSLNATVAVNMIALINSAKILRVHDVKAAVQTIKIYNAVFQKSL